MTKWIKVEDHMPEGNKAVLAFDGKQVIRACWTPKYSDNNCEHIEWADYNETDDDYYIPEGWYERIEHWDMYSSIIVHGTITHWMELPDKPEVRT